MNTFFIKMLHFCVRFPVLLISMLVIKYLILNPTAYSIAIHQNKWAKTRKKQKETRNNVKYLNKCETHWSWKLVFAFFFGFINGMETSKKQVVFKFSNKSAIKYSMFLHFVNIKKLFSHSLEGIEHIKCLKQKIIK